jgi:hypothetical protein
MERGGKFLDDCNQPAQLDTEVADLNGDGQPAAPGDPLS